MERVRVDIAGFHLWIGDVHYLLHKIKNFFWINMTMVSDSARPTLAVCVNDWKRGARFKVTVALLLTQY